LSLDAKKVESLEELTTADLDIIGIDEIHMFGPEEITHIENALSKGTEVIVSGLDMDYRGEMFPVVKKLLELGPMEVKYKRAVCHGCKRFSATHTQVYDRGIPLTEGMPAVIPDDGTFGYEPVCHACFVKKARRVV
jgi:thymidine kinase